MDTQLEQKIEQLNQKIDAVYASVEKMRKYFLWTLIITLILFIVPLIGLMFAAPSFLTSYTTSLDIAQ